MGAYLPTPMFPPIDPPFPLTSMPAFCTNMDRQSSRDVTLYPCHGHFYVANAFLHRKLQFTRISNLRHRDTGAMQGILFIAISHHTVHSSISFCQRTDYAALARQHLNLVRTTASFSRPVSNTLTKGAKKCGKCKDRLSVRVRGS